MAIAPVSAASSTSSNWLKEAQESLVASETPGGMMGALQDARAGYSIKTFLAKSQNNLYALAQIAQNAQTSSSALTVLMPQPAAKKVSEGQAPPKGSLNPWQPTYTRRRGSTRSSISETARRSTPPATS